MKIIVVLALYCSCYAANPPRSTICLLAYTRTGSTFLTYALHQLTHRTAPFLRNFGLESEGNPSKPPICRIHTSQRLNTLIQTEKSIKLLILLRNYKECILRQMSQEALKPFFLKNYQTSSVEDILTVLAKSFENRSQLMDDPHNYFALLQTFDTSSVADKMVVYYEDLIEDPRGVLSEVVGFLNEGEGRLEPFMENYQEHKKTCIQAYDKRFASMTRGEASVHHSLSLSKEVKCKIDQLVKDTFPNLWDRYLSRYQESRAQ